MTEDGLQNNIQGREENSIESPSTQSEFRCSYCSQTFETRNALFKHLRNDPVCSPKHDVATNDSDTKSSNGRVLTMVKESIALRFGYIDKIGHAEKVAITNDVVVTTMAESVGKILQDSFLESLREVVRKWYQLADSDLDTVAKMEILGSTQASLAKLRRIALKQEEGCAASADVLFANIILPKEIRKEPKEKQERFWTDVGSMTRNKLQSQIPQAELFDLQIVGTKRGTKLHAEKSATQYIYHYLLPLSWLPEGDAMRAWWQSSPEDPQKTKSQQFHQKRKIRSQPPESLKRLKDALRSAECEQVSLEELRADTERKLRLATGRFGALRTRIKRPWHNFADPSLKGNASPNNEPVWRAIDKVRIVDFVETGHGGDEMIAILEFRGDGFVQEQIRRIVGSAVAMTHSWLPSDFIISATNSDIAIETPLAPPNRLVLSAVRYHFDELQSSGRPFFEPHASRQMVHLTSAETDGLGWAINEILNRNEEEVKLMIENESLWLEDLNKIIAPRIQKELVMQQGEVSISPDTTSTLAYSKLYDPVLSELRRIKSSNLWPETSAARSTVIRQDKANVSDSREGKGDSLRQNGSFTIVNPKVKQNWDILPLGNKLFPELVEAVFDLEMNLAQSENATHKITDVNEITSPSSMKDREPSSHCAVNCNAQFTPHVDSGRGAGQKLSMIVGMGEYAGGELRVEGEAFDIQYKPLVFDGWKLRHWTNPFAGERFSLVYFTPEAKD